jgi:hypothetical protein
MTQADLNHEVASLTGETVRTIRQRGFSLIEIDCPPPLVVDWDELDSQRAGILPDRQHHDQLAA